MLKDFAFTDLHDCGIFDLIVETGHRPLDALIGTLPRVSRVWRKSSVFPVRGIIVVAVLEQIGVRVRFDVAQSLGTCAFKSILNEKKNVD